MKTVLFTIVFWGLMIPIYSQVEATPKHFQNIQKAIEHFEQEEGLPLLMELKDPKLNKIIKNSCEFLNKTYTDDKDYYMFNESWRKNKMDSHDFFLKVKEKSAIIMPSSLNTIVQYSNENELKDKLEEEFKLNYDSSIIRVIDHRDNSMDNHLNLFGFVSAYDGHDYQKSEISYLRREMLLMTYLYPQKFGLLTIEYGIFEKLDSLLLERKNNSFLWIYHPKSIFLPTKEEWALYYTEKMFFLNHENYLETFYVTKNEESFYNNETKMFDSERLVIRDYFQMTYKKQVLFRENDDGTIMILQVYRSH